MMRDELKESAEAVGWWLSAENASARRELAGRRPEIELWLRKVEGLVQQRLAQVEKEQEAKIKA